MKADATADAEHGFCQLFEVPAFVAYLWGFHQIINVFWSLDLLSNSLRTLGDSIQNLDVRVVEQTYTSLGVPSGIL